MRRVLVANRGEIASRILRACTDAGLVGIAVYADPDREAPFVSLAHDAFAIGGSTPRDSYLDVSKVLDAARRTRADAIHPGYGFLSENADFAQAVTDEGLVWIGPPPSAIRSLGDKVSARRIARSVGAPLAVGSDGLVRGVGDVRAFGDAYGFPLAVKAALGGGGRGLKVIRRAEEISELYESAVREAAAAFGDGACFVERYLDCPRHVETQCLADRHGDVVVMSTRDCTLQRRHQKLVEEAPAPFLEPEQRAALHRASKDILRTAGYVGAGTCEFLVGADGAITFLEVNTRLQVEHPVTEEVTGIDLVREMFRIADGERIGYDDPPSRGHAMEFRINGEDPGRDFLPTPGSVTRFDPPSGPGVRLDAGVVAGSVVSAAWDSMLAKLIVTGATRDQALQRAARALDEFVVQGVPTVLPFHRLVVRDPAFAAVTAAEFRVHTRWIETEFDGGIPPAPDTVGVPAAEPEQEEVAVEVDGRRVVVSMPALRAPARAAVAARPTRVADRRVTAQARTNGRLVSPLQGTVVKIVAGAGDFVEVGDLVVVMEAMKMEQPLRAHRAGVVRDLRVAIGATVGMGESICEIDDADEARAKSPNVGSSR